MGLFGKKKYSKNVTRDNTFLKDFAIKLNGLMRYTEGHPESRLLSRSIPRILSTTCCPMRVSPVLST